MKSAWSPAVVLLVLSPGIAAAAPPNVEYKILASTYDATPFESQFGRPFSPPVINDSGAVAFTSEESTTTILWQGDTRGALRDVAFASPGGFDGTFEFFLSFMLDNAGRLFFGASLALPFGEPAQGGYWVELVPGMITEIVRDGTPLATAGGDLFSRSEVKDATRFGNNGSILLHGHAGADECILAGEPGALQMVARSHQQPPGTEAGVEWESLRALAVSASGRYLFTGTFSGEGYGAWSDRSGTMENIFLNAVTAGVPPHCAVQPYAGPLLGATSNGAGKVCLSQFLVNEDTATAGDALFSDVGGPLHYEGGFPQPVPEMAGRDFLIIDTVLLNNQNRTVFGALLDGSDAAGGLNTVICEASGGNIRLVAGEGMQAPGVPQGVKFGNLLYLSPTSPIRDDPSSGSSGHIAFHASLIGTDVNSSNNTGIWMTDRRGQLHLIIRKGDTLDLGQGRRMTCEGFKLQTASGGDDGRPRCINSRGELAFVVTGGQNAIVVARFIDDPEPAVPLPELAIARGASGKVILTWDTTRADCILQSAGDAESGPWQDITTAPVLNGTVRSLEVEMTPGRRFFRLKSP